MIHGDVARHINGFAQFWLGFLIVILSYQFGKMVIHKVQNSPKNNKRRIKNEKKSPRHCKRRMILLGSTPDKRNRWGCVVCKKTTITAQPDQDERKEYEP